MAAWLVLSTSMLIFSNKASITLAGMENGHGEEAMEEGVETACFGEEGVNYKNLADIIESESLGTCLLTENNI